MPAPLHAFRLLTLIAAMAGGVVAAMVVQIMLGNRGIALTDFSVRVSAGHLRAALAWWAMAGAAFVASFAIAAVMSHVSWLYLRFLRPAAAAVLALALAAIANDATLPHDVAAIAHVRATLAALVVAMMMAGFGAFFAVRG